MDFIKDQRQRIYQNLIEENISIKFSKQRKARGRTSRKQLAELFSYSQPKQCFYKRHSRLKEGLIPKLRRLSGF